MTPPHSNRKCGCCRYVDEQAAGASRPKITKLDEVPTARFGGAQRDNRGVVPHFEGVQVPRNPQALPLSSSDDSSQPPSPLNPQPAPLLSPCTYGGVQRQGQSHCTLLLVSALCLLFIVFIVYCLLFILPFIVYFTVYCLLFMLYCLLFIVFIVYCLLFIVYCLLFLVSCFLFLVSCIGGLQHVWLLNSLLSAQFFFNEPTGCTISLPQIIVQKLPNAHLENT